MINYRRIYAEANNISLKDMKGYDVHHIDGNHNNNDPKNLQLLTPKEHAKIHQHQFVEWARTGAKLGNKAFIKRLKENGPTVKELQYKKIRIKNCKKGLHNVPHSEETKNLISKQKKEWHKDNKHPLLGKTTYVIVDNKGKEHTISENAKRWCEDRNISLSNLRFRKKTKGYTLLKYYDNNKIFNNR